MNMFAPCTCLCTQVLPHNTELQRLEQINDFGEKSSVFGASRMDCSCTRITNDNFRHVLVTNFRHVLVTSNSSWEIWSNCELYREIPRISSVMGGFRVGSILSGNCHISGMPGLPVSTFVRYLQCVAVCCSVSQCVAVCCSVLQGVAVIYLQIHTLFEPIATQKCANTCT